MEMTRLRLHTQALVDLVNDPGGPVAREVEAQAWRVQEEAYANINKPYRVFRSSRLGGPTNPPPGPPLYRTGDMRDSLDHTLGTFDGLGVYSDVTVRSSHRGFNYPQRLLDRGYEFVDLDTLKL